MDNTKKTLRDVLPQEFFVSYMTTSAITYDGIWPRRLQPSPAAKLLDVEVLEEMDSSIDSWRNVGGTQKNVHCWWKLANGKAVGWNENPSHGWSFPVITLKTKN